ncbi:MAG: NADH-quinone oxidoreductase subunit NuoF [Actinobacteria bacterium]|nr:NADH-quinone oxidoreductase subunit NuoF [Actinomycetota bacterium]
MSVTTERATAVFEALRLALRPEGVVAREGALEMRICAGTACHASGRVGVREAIKEELASRGLTDTVAVVETGCHGFCEQGPIVVIHPKGIFYPRVRPQQVAAIIEASVQGDGVFEKILYRDPATGEPLAHEADIPFYSEQRRLVLALNGKIDPFSIDDYLVRGGYAALASALSDDDPEAVIDLVEHSGLRGRGGAGFSTGTKWRYARRAQGDTKYIICNADEGDPGAFMDRSVLEGNPHAVLEGMLIAAFAIGAHEGYVYVRAEYPFAVERLQAALVQARERGLLGRDILGSGFAFDVHINEGAGAFVCGEETALIASIEGKRGMPRTRPPFPAVSGLWGRPTNINNVESFANIPWIMTHGAEAFAAMGMGDSRGTKIFSLTGKVANGGLVEVPMGATLRHIIFDIGGGMLPGRTFKAVQLGGPSGGCLPEEMLDVRVDYEELSASGAIVGSGGLVVVDDTNCMVDLARFFLQFTQDESCGRCVPCRLGTKRMLEILERITAGDGRERDIDLLDELAHYIIDGSLCALGGTAPNPVLTTIRYFRDELEAHITEKRCPAGQCKALITYYIDAEACTGCTLCAKKCPTGCISGEKKQPHVIDVSNCIKCDTCRQACRFGAVKVHSGIEQPLVAASQET